MSIMVFMTNECETSVPLAAFRVKAPTLRHRLFIRSCQRTLPWIFCAVVYGWAAISIHATLRPLGSQTGVETLTAVTSTQSVIPGLEMIYPVFGLLAAVACTYILRRRRIAQLQSMADVER
jgi:hypothetical protein